MARATSSLPVPLSPWITTGISVRAATAISSRTCAMAWPPPMMRSVRRLAGWPDDSSCAASCASSRPADPGMPTSPQDIRCGEGNIGTGDGLFQPRRGLFPTPCSQRPPRTEDRQGQEETQSRQEEHPQGDLPGTLRPDQGEQEGVLDDGVAGAEEQAEAVQLLRADFLFLGDRDDDARPVGDAEEEPGRQRHDAGRRHAEAGEPGADHPGGTRGQRKARAPAVFRIVVSTTSWCARPIISPSVVTWPRESPRLPSAAVAV